MSNMIRQQLEAGLGSALSALARSPLRASCSRWHAVNLPACRHLGRFRLVSFTFINLCANYLLGRISVRFTFTFGIKPGSEEVGGVANSQTSGGFHPKLLFLSLGVFLVRVRL